MTTEKARKILKGFAKNLKDSEIQKIITSFDAVIEVGFRQFERQRLLPLDTGRKNLYNFTNK